MEGLDDRALEKLEDTEAMDEGMLPEFIRTDEIGEAPSMEIQAWEIRDAFCEIPELQFDRWKELGTKERMEVLNNLESRTAEIEQRTPMEVRCEPMESNLRGYFYGQSLFLSEQFVMDDSYDSYKETLTTLFHEGRHAYQNYNLYAERVEQSDELVESWNINYNVLGYEDGSSLIPELGYFEYYTQPVEVDARVFAETVLHALNI